MTLYRRAVLSLQLRGGGGIFRGRVFQASAAKQSAELWLQIIVYSGDCLLQVNFVPLPERQLIAMIRRMARSPGDGVGIGDDCAVIALPKRHEALVTTDFSIENIHFRREWHPPDSVGWRCLARGLSDIAAMGGKPRAAFLSLALPRELPQKWVDQFFTGLLKLATEYEVQLAGGDIAESPAGVLADIVVLGSVPKGKALLRSGARIGDFIYVTGMLGTSVATLGLLREGKRPRVSSHERHFYPQPRLAVGQYLREKKLASAMIDTSDGLSVDLRHVCDESGVGAVIYAESLPRLPGSRGLQLALHGGEDYELLFTAAPTKQVPDSIDGVRVTRVGEITSGNSIHVADTQGRSKLLQPEGWQHFG
jgi:thiamine-monophosphate kinase